MSALAIVTAPRGVVVASDGASVMPDGTLGAIGSKVRLMPEASCLLTGRGAVLAGRALEASLSSWTARPTLDGIEAAMPDMMAEAGAILRAYGEAGSERFSAYLCGWSAARGAPVALAFRSYDHAGTPAGFAARLPEVYLAPEIPPDVATAFRLPAVTDVEAWRRDPKGLAVLAICAARFCPGWATADRNGPGDVTMVGGFVQLTTVGADVVASAIVHAWPDKLGARMDVGSGAPFPTVRASAG